MIYYLVMHAGTRVNILATQDASLFRPIAGSKIINLLKTLKGVGLKFHTIQDRLCGDLLAHSILESDFQTVNFFKTCRFNEATSQEVVARIFLAHVWGVSGAFSYIGQSGPRQFVELEGMKTFHCLKKMSQYIDTFFLQNELRTFGLSHEMAMTIKSTLKLAHSFHKESNLRICQRLRQGLPYLFSGGSMTHAVSIFTS